MDIKNIESIEFNDLCNDNIHYLVGYCDLNSIILLTSLNKRLNALLNQNLLWNQLSSRDFSHFENSFFKSLIEKETNKNIYQYFFKLQNFDKFISKNFDLVDADFNINSQKTLKDLDNNINKFWLNAVRKNYRILKHLKKTKYINEEIINEAL